MIRGFTVGAVVLTLIAVPLASQQHQHEGERAATGAQQMDMSGCSMMEHMGQMMGGNGGMAMMPAMNFFPQNVLRHKGALTLTQEQISRIEAVSGGTMGSHEMTGMAMKDMPMMKEMQSHQQDLRAAFDQTPVDPAAIQAAMGKMATLHGKMMAEHLVRAAKVRDLLTPAQRDQLAKMPPCAMKEGMGPMGPQPSGEQHHPPPTP